MNGRTWQWSRYHSFPSNQGAQGRGTLGPGGAGNAIRTKDTPPSLIKVHEGLRPSTLLKQKTEHEFFFQNQSRW